MRQEAGYPAKFRFDIFVALGDIGVTKDAFGRPVIPKTETIMPSDMPVLTAHAARRCAGRAIPAEAVDLLLDHARPARSHGADRYSFDRASRHHLRAELGDRRFRDVERWLDAYAVVSDDGHVITAAWRTRRHHR